MNIKNWLLQINNIQTKLYFIDEFEVYILTSSDFNKISISYDKENKEFKLNNKQM